MLSSNNKLYNCEANFIGFLIPPVNDDDGGGSGDDD